MGFYRSSDERVIAGVCAGIAHKLDLNWAVLMAHPTPDGSIREICELARRLSDFFGDIAAPGKSDWRTITVKVRSYNDQNPARPIPGLRRVKLQSVTLLMERPIWYNMREVK